MNNNLLDIVVIYRAEDYHYLKDLIATIPKFANLILVKTIKGVENGLLITDQKDGLTQAILNYTELDFSYLRNQANRLAKSKFILSLDADERLLVSQHNQLFLTLKEYENNEVIGGVYFRNLSTHTSQLDQYGLFIRSLVPQTKLFRNGSIFKGAVHETLITPSGTELCDSVFIVHHVGYEVSESEMLVKLERNNAIKFANDAKNFTENNNQKAQNHLENIKQSIINKEF